MCVIDASDGFNLSQTGEHQFQFLDVTSSVSVDDAATQPIAGATHYYASLQQPQPFYFIIDQSAGPVLTSSTYVATVPPMITPQMQSAGMMLPPGMIAAPAQTGNLLPPTLLRPGLMQQPAAPGVIMPSGLMPAPPAGILPPAPATSIMAPHAAMLPLAQTMSPMPMQAVNELPFNASTGTTLATVYSESALVADTNGLDSHPLNSVAGDMHMSAKSAEHESVYISTDGSNVNNSAAEQTVHSDCDAVVATEPTEASTEFVDSVDRDVSEPDNSLATYELCNSTETATQLMEQPAAAATVNGELTVDALHELGSSSESSSVASPSSVLADMSLNDNACDRDVSVSKDSSISTPQSSTSTASIVSPLTSVKTKAPSWASLLKDTTSATNAIVINMNDNHAAAAAQQKTDVKSVVKEPVTQQSMVSHVSNDEKLKLEVSGLFLAVLLRLFTCIFICSIAIA